MIVSTTIRSKLEQLPTRQQNILELGGWSYGALPSKLAITQKLLVAAFHCLYLLHAPCFVFLLAKAALRQLRHHAPFLSNKSTVGALQWVSTAQIKSKVGAQCTAQPRLSGELKMVLPRVKWLTYFKVTVLGSRVRRVLYLDVRFHLTKVRFLLPPPHHQ